LTDSFLLFAFGLWLLAFGFWLLAKQIIKKSYIDIADITKKYESQTMLFNQ